MTRSAMLIIVGTLVTLALPGATAVDDAGPSNEPCTETGTVYVNVNPDSCIAQTYATVSAACHIAAVCTGGIDD